MFNRVKKYSFLAIFAIGMVAVAHAANIPVTNLNDSGPGSLREAINLANANSDLDVIDFSAVKSANVETIHLETPLPPITSPVSMDGSISEDRSGLPGDMVLNSGPGFSLSGAPSLRPGIELDGSLAISKSDTDPGFFIFNFQQAVACDDPAYVSGDRCYATDPEDPLDPQIYVYKDSNKEIKYDLARAQGIWLKDHTGSSIRGFIVNRFTGYGILMLRGGEHKIFGNYVGTDKTGTMTGTEIGSYLTIDLDPASSTFGWVERDLTPDSTFAYGNGFPKIDNPDAYFVNPEGKIFGPSLDGISMYGSSDNQIGGLAANDRNISSANEANGIDIQQAQGSFFPLPASPSDRNLIQGNFAGTGAFGVEPFGNMVFGILAGGGNEHEMISNVVADNGYLGRKTDPSSIEPWAGMQIIDTTKNVVSHNHSGTDVSGTIALGNAGDGIFEISSSYTEIKMNVASANLRAGITSQALQLFGPSENTTISDNYIGTDVTGVMPLGNTNNGIFVQDTSNYTIERNVAAANKRNGIVLQLNNEAVLRDNYIGTDATGLIPLGNAIVGIFNYYGSNDIIERNVVAANKGSGIEMYGGNGVILKDNIIGANVDKSTLGNEFGNKLYGITQYALPISDFEGLPGTNHQIVGNFIANNTLAGISSFYQQDLLIEGNTVLKNGFGKDLVTPDGVVDGDVSAGIEISNQSSRVNIHSNWVGIDPNNPNDSTLGNAAGGVAIGSTITMRLYADLFPVPSVAPQQLLVTYATGQPVGPNEFSVQENTIAYNGAAGITVGGDLDDGVTEVCGFLPCVNIFYVLFDPSAPVYTPLPYNDGVPGDSMGVKMLGNSIFSNAALGIDLTQAARRAEYANDQVWTVLKSDLDGVNANDAADSDAGPNGLQNYPEITKAEASGNHLKRVKGVLDSAPGNYRVEFFVNENDDPSGHGQGEKFAGFVEFEIVNSGPHAFSLQCHGINAANGCPKVKGLGPLQKLNVTSTATNLDTGNTSEFSLDVELDKGKKKHGGHKKWGHKKKGHKWNYHHNKWRR